MTLRRYQIAGSAMLLLVSLTGCSRTEEKASSGSLKKMPANQQYSGFLKDYSALKPNPALDEDAMTYVNPDKMKSLHRYVAVMIDPIEVYVATNADDSLIPKKASESVTNYFRHSLVSSLSDAFAIVDTPGPLVLRLRAAIVGLDTGGEVAPVENDEEKMDRAIVLEKVGVEMELVDSESGERIAAAVDKAKLGAGAQVGSVNFSRHERFVEATAAFDQWAGRLRQFLDSAHELTGEDAKRADAAYRPYNSNIK